MVTDRKLNSYNYNFGTSVIHHLNVLQILDHSIIAVIWLQLRFAKLSFAALC
jgi:hypothetical protein